MHLYVSHMCDQHSDETTFLKHGCAYAGRRLHTYVNHKVYDLWIFSQLCTRMLKGIW